MLPMVEVLMVLLLLHERHSQQSVLAGRQPRRGRVKVLLLLHRRFVLHHSVEEAERPSH